MSDINPSPFSLRIFVADGDGIGKALVFLRALLPQVKARAELAQTGSLFVSQHAPA